MLQTLKRDWWKLLLIVLVYGGLSILTRENIMKLYSQPISNEFSGKLIVIITIITLFLLPFLKILLVRVLPAFIHEQKNLWNIAWKFLVLRILCEVIVTILFAILPVYEVRPLFIAVMLVFFIVVSTLFLGFLCAAANSTGLIAGIKTLFTKYFLKYVCILVIVWLIQKLPALLIEVDYIRGVLIAIIQIAIVYICLPLFKEPAK